MTGRRALSDMLVEVIDGVALHPGPGLRATSIEVTLPVEAALDWSSTDPVFLAELPRFIYRTAFDLAPSRLTVLWAERENA